jgi:methyltransferase (TIGR00027 family)
MTQAAAKTGLGPTSGVAVEQHFPKTQRILEDELAYHILPFSMRAFVSLMWLGALRDWMVRTSEKRTPGIWGGVMCRKRYIDEKLCESRSQIRTVVNLGAGFDTRAYRLPALADLPIWEVDQPENIEAKRRQLQRIFGEVPAHVKLVPIDFDHEELDAALLSQGYPADQPTFFIGEAVTQYLTEKGIQTMFAFLAHAVQGSRLAFSYVRKDFIDGKVRYGQEMLYQQYIVSTRAWLFGLDPENVANFLKPYGWDVVEDVDVDNLAERYVKPTDRRLAITPIERVVYAEKV